VFYIYQLFNSITGKSYIGFSSNPEKRWKYHKWRATSTHLNSKLDNAIRKYGTKTFDFRIIYSGENYSDTLNVKEPYFIKKFDSFENGYNMSLGGEAVMTGRKHSKKTKSKMSQNHRDVRAEKNPFFGKTHSIISINKIKTNLPDRKGSKNPASRTYIVTFPNGKIEKIDDLSGFCKKQNILRGSALVSAWKGSKMRNGFIFRYAEV
jgi:group I intron endonuclease